MRGLFVTAKVSVLLLYPFGYHIMLVVDVVLWHHSFVELLAASLLWRDHESYFTGRGPSSQFQLRLLCILYDVFSNGNLPSISWKQPRAAAIGYMFWESLTALANNSSKAFWFGVFVRWFLGLGRRTISSDEKSSLKLHTHTHTKSEIRNTLEYVMTFSNN